MRYYRKKFGFSNKKVTLSVLAVDQNYRNLKVATKLVKEFENICRNIGLHSISLGADRELVTFMKS